MKCILKIYTVFFIFINEATREFKIIYIACFIFLLDSTAVDHKFFDGLLNWPGLFTFIYPSPEALAISWWIAIYLLMLIDIVLDIVWIALVTRGRLER